MKKNKSGSAIAIGSAIRHRRKQLNMTMKELAESTDLSIGFISQIERNLTTPSLSSLASIASVMKVDIGYFTDVPKGAESFFKKKNREFFSLDNPLIKYCRLNKDLPGSQLRTVMIETEKGYVSEKVFHEGEEQIYLLEGKGFVVLNDERFDLEQGDCIHYISSTPHQYGSDDSKCLWLFVGTQNLFPADAIKSSNHKA